MIYEPNIFQTYILINLCIFNTYLQSKQHLVYISFIMIQKLILLNLLNLNKIYVIRKNSILCEEKE